MDHQDIITYNTKVLPFWSGIAWYKSKAVYSSGREDIRHMDVHNVAFEILKSREHSRYNHPTLSHIHLRPDIPSTVLRVRLAVLFCH